MPFLPITREEMKERGIEQFDFVYVIGDAYVDHSSFGPAIISRVLEANGYSVGIISQPDWKDENSISIFGEPRLGFLVSSGNMDSMVNHYTVAKKHRKTDAFTPGGVMGKRPDRAVTVYGNLIRRTYKHTPMILGGIEASLRRLSHYDYWSDKVRRSVLLDSGADLISYGMGELSIVAIADALAAGIDVHDITFIPGTVYRSKTLDHLIDPVVLPSFEEVRESKRTYAESFAIQYKNTDAINAKPMAEPYEGQGYIVQNPPSRPLTEQEMDDVYALPYMRAYHPSYEKDGGVPALGEIKYSLTSNRGCFGSCSFCALTFHEGRVVQQSLVSWGMDAFCVQDFSGVLAEFAVKNPQLVLMDIHLPFFNGFHWCQEIRKVSKVPVIFLSSASDNMNIIMAVNMGGDDFIAKPFDLSVLTAKVQAMLRRTYEFAGETNFLEHRGAMLDTGSGVLNYRGKRIELTKNEWRILQSLLENKGKAVSRDMLMMHLWESDSFIDDNTLTVNVTRLRKKLEEAGLTDFIQTKKGVGYLIA